jgi:hypothetical protein
VANFAADPPRKNKTQLTFGEKSAKHTQLAHLQILNNFRLAYHFELYAPLICGCGRLICLAIDPD